MNAEVTPRHSTDWYVDHLVADAERFAQVLESASHDTPIAGCPGWDLRRLAEHLGQVHRWANFCVRHPQGPPTKADAEALESFESDRAADWFRDGAGQLAATLRSIDPDSAAWHPFPVPHLARVWPRRQAHETAIHRWDAEHAAGGAASIDAELASDGIDEYFEIALPRRVVRDGVELPAGSLHVHCTDVAGEWLVWSEDDEYRMIREHRKGDAALRGAAAPILLALWGRVGSDELDVVGDETVLADWLGVSGM